MYIVQFAYYNTKAMLRLLPAEILPCSEYIVAAWEYSGNYLPVCLLYRKTLSLWPLECGLSHYWYLHLTSCFQCRGEDQKYLKRTQAALMLVTEQTENGFKWETSCLEVNRLTAPSERCRKIKLFSFIANLDKAGLLIRIVRDTYGI